MSHAAHLVPTHGMHERAAWRPVSPTQHLHHSNVKLTVGDVTAHLVFGHDQVLGDGLLLLFVVGHGCIGSQSVSLSVNTLSGQQKSVTLPEAQAARRPSRSAHGLHAQRSHAHYAATSEVSSYTMAPKKEFIFK